MRKTIVADHAKARSLLSSAHTVKERLDATDKRRFPSNTIVDYYDITHMHLEAIGLSVGVKFKGEAAHQELIEYVCTTWQLGEQTRQRLQELRTWRNKILYEGLKMKTHFVEANEQWLLQTIERLASILESITPSGRRPAP